MYFYNTGTQQSTYEHPMDEFYRKVTRKLTRPAPSGANKKSFLRGAPMQHFAPRRSPAS